MENIVKTSDWMMFWVTIALALIGLAQFVMFYRQLKAMRAGLADTAAAAEAAVANVNTLKQTGVAQLRAYLAITQPAYIQRNGQMGMEFKLKNVGSTPAFGVRFKARVFVAPFPLQEPLARFQFDESFGGSTYAVFPGVDVDAQEPGDDLPSTEQWAQLSQKTHAIYLYVQLTYKDAFTDSHETRACWHSGAVIGGDTGHFYAYRDGNDAT